MYPSLLLPLFISFFLNFFLFSTALYYHLPVSCEERGEGAAPDFPRVYLTVSPLYRESVTSKQLVDRELQVHWHCNDTSSRGVTAEDRILIYNREPTLGEDLQPILMVKPSDYPDCWVQTNYSLGSLDLPGGWDRLQNSDIGSSSPYYSSHPSLLPGDHCLSLWLALYRREELVFSDCLKIRPTWMQDSRYSLEKLRLSEAFLPGTHNSGSYRRGSSLSYKDTAGRYIVTQDLSVWEQLVYGVRYLDLRVAYYSTAATAATPPDNSSICDSCFWINHDLIKVRPLLPVLQDIKTFLSKTSDEILLLDLHRFPAGFNNRPYRHTELVRLLKRELGEWALDYQPTLPTFGEIWERKKRIIIFYGDLNTANQVSWLWRPMRQAWGNRQSVTSLFSFLDGCMRNESLSGGLWTAMAELTPAPMDLLLKPKGSLRHLAQQVNGEVTRWCRDLWWRTANIVAVDFILSTDLISVGVATNLYKGSPSKKYSIHSTSTRLKIK